MGFYVKLRCLDRASFCMKIDKRVMRDSEGEGATLFYERELKRVRIMIKLILCMLDFMTIFYLLNSFSYTKVANSSSLSLNTL